MLSDPEYIIENDNEYDNENESNVLKYDNVNYFLNNYSYELICFFENLKKRFVLNPDFLCKCSSTIFIHFLIDILYNINENLPCFTIYDEYDINVFNMYFHNEFIISFEEICKFLNDVFPKSCVLTIKNELYDKWKYFCFTYSDVPLF